MNPSELPCEAFEAREVHRVAAGRLRKASLFEVESAQNRVDTIVLVFIIAYISRTPDLSLVSFVAVGEKVVLTRIVSNRRQQGYHVALSQS